MQRDPVGMQERVLAVHERDRVAERRRGRDRVDPLPPEVARVEVDADVVARDRAEQPVRLGVVDRRAGMELEADDDVRRRVRCPGGELAPVRRDPLPLRDYAALNNTVDELIAFGNAVALKNGWIANPELLPPDVLGGKNGEGDSADDLKAALVGKIVSGTAYSRAEVYQSGVVTLPLQQTNVLDRLHAMNQALADYGAKARARSAHPAQFVAFQVMPGNSVDRHAKSVCWH